MAEELTPHERAVRRCETARDTLKIVQEETQAALSAAEDELGEALAELARYEKRPGVPLPAGYQLEVEQRWLWFRERYTEKMSDDSSLQQHHRACQDGGQRDPR